MNGKKGLMKGEYYMEVLGYDEKKVVQEVIDDRVVEQVK